MVQPTKMRRGFDAPGLAGLEVKAVNPVLGDIDADMILRHTHLILSLSCGTGRANAHPIQLFRQMGDPYWVIMAGEPIATARDIASQGRAQASPANHRTMTDIQ